MPSRPSSYFSYLGALGLIGVIAYCLQIKHPNALTTQTRVAPTIEQTAAASQPLLTASSSSVRHASQQIAATTTPLASSTASATPKTTTQPQQTMRTSVAATSSDSSVSTSSQPRVMRIQNPYNTPPLSSPAINVAARNALVNILCMPRAGGSLAPISGSGVIIDERGVILTNAHVAQYVLLSESPKVDLRCLVRTGSPATAQWTADVLYMPPTWVRAHANELNSQHPTGTGEHDYALLRVTGLASGAPANFAFPYVPFDTREGIGFQGDQVLGASYPAEFLGGMAAENNLYAVSSVSAIDQLLTFATKTVDAISIGGVIEAQSGSSGGGVLNAWGRLIGIISTTSDAPTTAARDLRAITLSYIDRDMQIQSGSGLTSHLSGNLADNEASFNASLLPDLLDLFFAKLSH